VIETGYEGAETRRGAFDTELAIRANGPTRWTLTNVLIWTGTRGDTFTVPVGFVTDFATVPRALHWLVSPYGAYTRAAVLHDWLLDDLERWYSDRRYGGPSALGNPDSRLPSVTSRDADGIFRRVMEDLGVGAPTRWAMWSAVRLASLANPARAYGRGFMADAPRVIGVAALALAPVAIGASGVLLALGLIRLARLVAGLVGALTRRAR
jgi:hypothetical protein